MASNQSLTLNRYEVKNRLVELFTDHAVGFQASYGPPRRLYETTGVYLGDIVGELDMGHLRSGRKPTEDVFDIRALCWSIAKNDTDGREADRMVMTTAAAVHKIIAEHHNLNSLLGLMQCYWQGTATGPDPVPTDDGWMSEFTATIHCVTRVV